MRSWYNALRGHGRVRAAAAASRRAVGRKRPSGGAVAQPLLERPAPDAARTSSTDPGATTPRDPAQPDPGGVRCGEPTPGGAAAAGRGRLRRRASHRLRAPQPLPRDPAYRGRYAGAAGGARTAVYHQGIAWGWLLARPCSAHLRAWRPREAARAVSRPAGSSRVSDAGLGSIAEVFDGDAPVRAGRLPVLRPGASPRPCAPGPPPSPGAARQNRAPRRAEGHSDPPRRSEAHDGRQRGAAAPGGSGGAHRALEALGALRLRSGSGAPCARTTARTGRRGSTCRTTSARSRAYRWGEDGILGISDNHQRLCLALVAVERSRPHPQGAALRAHRQRGQPRRGREGVLLLPRLHAHPLLHEGALQVPAGGVPLRAAGGGEPPAGRSEPEFELLDTGVFDDDRYFDVAVEYAKAGVDDILVRITATNRGPAAALCTSSPPSGSATPGPGTWEPSGPRLARAASDRGHVAVEAEHPTLGTRRLYCEGAPRLYFTENETNQARLFDCPGATLYVKDGINDAVVGGRADAVNPAETGTKVGAHYAFDVPAGASVSVPAPPRRRRSGRRPVRRGLRGGLRRAISPRPTPSTPVWFPPTAPRTAGA